MRRLFAAAAALTCAALLGAAPAPADLAQSAVVSANPVDFTPHVLDGTVWALAVVGDTVVVGGSFTKVQDSPRKTTYDRQEHFRVRAARRRDPFVRPAGGRAPSTRWPPARTTPSTSAAPSRRSTGPPSAAWPGSGARRRPRCPRFRAKINWGDVRALNARGSRLYAGGTFSAINGVTRAGAGPAGHQRRGGRRLRRETLRAGPEPDPGRTLRRLPRRLPAGRGRRAAQGRHGRPYADRHVQHVGGPRRRC